MSNSRKAKNRMNRIQKRYHVGSYVVGCNNHPGIVIRKDNWKRDYNQRFAIWEGDYEVKSLIDGSICSCSVFNCGLEAEPKERIISLANDMTLKNEGKISEYDFNVKWHGQEYADKVQHFNETGEWDDKENMK